MTDDHDVHDVEQMEIEMSPTVTHDSQPPPFILPPMTFSNQVHVQGGSSVQDVEVSMDLPSVTHDSQHAPFVSPSATSVN